MQDWTHSTWTISLKIGQNSNSINNFMMEVTLISGETIQLIVLGEFGKTKQKLSHNYTWHCVLKYSRSFKCKYKNTSEFKEILKRLCKTIFFVRNTKVRYHKYHRKLSEKRESVSRLVVFDSAISWIVAHQAPLSMGFSWQDYWSGLPFPPPGESSQPRSWTQIPCIEGWFFTVWATTEHLKIKEIHIAKSNIKNIDIKWYTWKRFRRIYEGERIMILDMLKAPTNQE